MLLGVDLGGTKTEAIVLDRDGGEHFRQRLATPAASYEGILDTIARLVSQAEAQCGRFDSVGICTPGAVVPETGLLKNSNTVCLNGKPLPADLARRLGKPVFIENDANCFALSEATDGAGADSASVFGVILGTGAGGGWVIHGRLHTGVNGIAGEWGHNPLPRAAGEARPARPCYCGRVDCIETYVSGPGFARTHGEIAGEDIPAVQVAARLMQGDAAAAEAFARYVNHLARALATVINVCDPDVVVLGGGMSQMSEVYPRLVQALPGFVFSDTIKTRILPPAYGDSSGVRGAAWLNRGR
jgi:fructokinase